MPAAVEKIGVIVVHGIGEQKRFEHLEGQVRQIVDALRQRSASPQLQTQLTVEIVEGNSSTLYAEHDTWQQQNGAAVRVIVVERAPNGAEVEKHLHFHEVWWADANEPYSLWKQVRFWAWGLSMWTYPSKPSSRRHGFRTLTPPSFPGWNAFQEFVVRAKLFAVGVFFVVAAYSLGVLVFLAKRLLDLSPPDVVRVFVNYVAGVKLYNQPKRAGGGFLDALDEPPRYSVRRRMARAICDVACADYERWYVLAHSLGSVVAYNGLMEPSHSLGNYLNEDRWALLLARTLAGRARYATDTVGPVDDMMPPRPLWMRTHDDYVVYRDKLFERFRGLLTFGSPLDKFAAIWPARVPINESDRAFQQNAEWINVYDPTDPVGANLDAFGTYRPSTGIQHTLRPQNHGYRAHPLLLYSHLCYLRIDSDIDNQLGDGVVEWMLGGQAFGRSLVFARAPWFAPRSWTDHARNWWTRFMWIVAFLVLAALGNVVSILAWPLLTEMATKAIALASQVWAALKSVMFIFH